LYFVEVDFDIMGSNDSPGFFALKDDVLNYLNPKIENNCKSSSQNTAYNQLTQINEDIHLNRQTSPGNFHH